MYNRNRYVMITGLFRRQKIMLHRVEVRESALKQKGKLEKGN